MSAEILRCPQGGILVVDGLVLSAWTRPYDVAAVALLDAAVATAARNAPAAVGALGIYRLKGMREMPGAVTREALAAVGGRYPVKVMVTVLDSSGFANAIIRLFLQGLGRLSSDSRMTIAATIDEGIEQLAAVGLDVGKVRGALERLTTEVFGSKPR